MSPLLLAFLFASSLRFVTTNYVLLEPEQIHLTVPIGRRVQLSPRDLGLHSNHSSTTCVLELISGEAITQRVGRFQPEVIDCNFQNGSVFYSHFGSRLLPVDLVRLRVIRLLTNHPEVQPIDLHFHIQFNVPYKSVSVLSHLSVPSFFGLSQPLDSRVLQFHSTCRVTLRVASVDTKWPKYGQLVHGRNRTLADEPLTTSCLVFPHLNLRYEHLSPPTPEVDYIELLVESLDENDDQCSATSCLRREWMQLKVVIENAKPNFPPKMSPHVTLRISGHLQQPEVVTSLALFATDNETAAANLLFNLTRPPTSGYFHFLSFPTKPLLSFLQRDVIDRRLAFTGTRIGMETIRIDVIDEFFVANVLPTSVSVEIKDSGSGEVRVVSPLIVFEGASGNISSKNIELKGKRKSKDPPRISFQVISGPHNGVLSTSGGGTNRGALKFFYWYDVEWGLVNYAHDGSDTSADEILLLVGQQRLRLHVTIVPIDDSPPQLVVNRGLSVDEGRTIALSNEDLNAVDPDTSNEDITYEVVRPPQGGYLLKRLGLREGFVQLTNFTQNDVDQGLIVYTHANSQLFFDEFQIVLKDNKYPSPNESPQYDVSVVINPLANDPPRPVLTASFRSVVKETEVLPLTRSLIGYIDKAAREDDIRFNLTTPLPLSHGKLVMTTSGGSKDQLELFPAITSFSQLQVNRRQVVYVPPTQDIGPHLLHVYVTFAAQDGYGNTAPPHQLYIQVLPVDNKPPELKMALSVVVGRGETVAIGGSNLRVSDVDTEEEDVTCRVTSKASHGTLLLDDAPLHVSAPFALRDIGEGRVRYAHRGFSLKRDAVAISVSDGKNPPAVGVMEIVVKEPNGSAAITDLPDTSTSDQLTVSVLENDFITIPTELLSAEPGSSSQSNVQYAIVKDPHHGSVYVRGRRSSTFSQAELDNGEVKYIHDGTEIGHRAQIDDLWITVNDGGASRSRSTDDTVHTLKINILPVDNVPPLIMADKPLHLLEGGSAVLSEQNIVIRDNDSLPEHIILVVSKPPLYGLIQLDGKRTKHFRWSQMINGQVKYTQTHHRYLEQRWDSMIVYATDSYHRSESIKIDMNITLINDEIPVITVKNISLTQRGSKVLDRSVLSIADLDWPSDTITLSVATPPVYGRLVVTQGQNTPTVDFTSARLTDWEKHPARYLHTAAHTKPDFFTFSINDGVNRVLTTMWVNVSAAPPAVKVFKEEALKLELLSPETLEEFSDGVSGFVFTRHHFKLTTSGRTEEISFGITTKPTNGRLENSASGQKDITAFDMKDVLNEHIRYVIVNGIGERDHFSFSIKGSHSDSSYTMRMEWAVIFFPRPTMKVCEDVGVVSIPVGRSSNFNHSSFVHIRSQPETAAEWMDYKPSRVQSLHFGPGVGQLSWEVSVVSDPPDPLLVETFTLRLQQPVNALLLPEKSTCQVQIVDQRRGGCGKEDQTSFTPSITDTVTNPQECSKRNAGQKLLINYGSIKISLLCDGIAWKPVPN